jgi:hypothetical protein
MCAQSALSSLKTEPAPECYIAARIPQDFPDCEERPLAAKHRHIEFIASTPRLSRDFPACRAGGRERLAADWGGRPPVNVVNHSNAVLWSAVSERFLSTLR